MEFKNFTETARALAKNPLGIIALFIVMVYALASLVLSIASAEFYQHPLHPSVLFLALFPVCVLLTFAYLVAKHHEKLYGPGDYHDQRDFSKTFNVPKSIVGRTGIATSDIETHLIEPSSESALDEAYSSIIQAGFVLIHEAVVDVPRTSPRSGRFTARIWIEPLESRSMSDISSVTYKVWSDFSPDKYKTEDIHSNFDLWLSVYGEFPVIALVKFKNGKSVFLNRYIDLPTRPQD